MVWDVFQVLVPDAVYCLSAGMQEILEVLEQLNGLRFFIFIKKKKKNFLRFYKPKSGLTLFCDYQGYLQMLHLKAVAYFSLDQAIMGNSEL